MNVFLKLGTIAVMTGTLAVAADTKQPYRPDPWITTKTKLALYTAEDVSGTSINVDTFNGRVTLHGKVETAAERTRAEEIAKRIEGVLGVRNLVQVVPGTKKKSVKFEDAVVADRVKLALDSDAALKDSQVRVASVNNGVVLLDGKASSLSAHLRAVRVATRVEGVNRVASEVKSPEVLSDREIRMEEEAAQKAPAPSTGTGSTFLDMWITTSSKARLLADGDTPAMDINVDTDDGVVTLFGVVPTEGSKAAAEAEVWKVSGVKKVDNALQVVPSKDQKAVEVRDADAVTDAKAALAEKAAFKDVSVDVKNGAARLTGTVANQADWLMAAVTVRSSPGIRSVNNDLKVKP
ncbi:MAG TPA: BON domain-containing protein [Candidatus Polarisedimenticolaceae bacterium]